MSVYSAHEFWSPLLGMRAVRLSMADARGGEYWRIIPRLDGKRYRTDRDAALDAIEEAMARRREPGEVE